jgi:hypothetical protein
MARKSIHRKRAAHKFAILTSPVRYGKTNRKRVTKARRKKRIVLGPSAFW